MARLVLFCTQAPAPLLGLARPVAWGMALARASIQPTGAGHLTRPQRPGRGPPNGGCVTHLTLPPIPRANEDSSEVRLGRRLAMKIIACRPFAPSPKRVSATRSASNRESLR